MAVAESLIQQAQEVIDILSSGGDSLRGNAGARILFGQGKDRVRLQFAAAAGKLQVIAASTNLIDWELIGVATENTLGAFEFEDPAAARFPARFYRIISP